MRSLLAIAACLIAAPALAAEVSVGLMGGVNIDLPDKQSKGYAKIKPGPMVVVPIRWHATDLVAVKGSLRFDMAGGTDRVTWSQWVDGQDMRFFDDDSAAVLGGFGASLGAELHLPLEWVVRPYGGAEIGVMGVGVWHTLGSESEVIYDSSTGGAVGPSTMQAAVVTDVHVGARLVFGKVSIMAELGYASSYLPAKKLAKTLVELDARREALGWNAFRAGAGFAISL